MLLVMFLCSAQVLGNPIPCVNPSVNPDAVGKADTLLDCSVRMMMAARGVWSVCWCVCVCVCVSCCVLRGGAGICFVLNACVPHCVFKQL